MSMNTPTMEIILSLIDQISAPMRKQQEGINGFVASVQKGVTEAFTKVGEVIAGAFATEKVLEFFKSTVERAAAAEVSTGQLRQAVNNAGESYQKWTPQIDATFDRLKSMTVFTDTDMRQALGNMIAKSGDVQGSINNMGLAADIAAKKNISMADAGDMVGKAMTGNNRVFKDWGITAGTNAEKMEQLREKTRGYAEEELGTMDGQLKQVKRSWDEMEVSVGQALITQGNMKDGAKRLSDDIKELTPVLVTVGGALASFFVGIFDSIKNTSDRWAFSLALWQAQVEMFVGNAIVKFAVLGDKALGWIPGIGKGIDAAAAAAINVGGDMVAHAITIEGNLAAAVQQGQSEQTKIVIDEAQKRTKSMTKEQEDALKKQLEALKAAREAVATLTAGFVKDFAGTMPTAAAEVQNKIQAITDDIAKWQEASKGATGKTLEGFQAAITKGEDMRAMYRAVLPVFSDLADLSRQLTATESDPEPHLRLLALNDELAKANTLRASTLGNSAAQKDLDKVIAEIQKDIAAATKETQIAGADLTPALEDQKQLEFDIEVKEKAREAHAQMVRDAIKETVSQAISLATQMGAVDQQTAGVLTSAIGIGQALASGDMVGAIAGFGGLLGSLFGESPENTARKALLAKNNERLDELTRTTGRLVDQNDSGTKIDRVMQALDSVGTSFVPGVGAEINSGDVAANLVKSGGSFQDVVDLAKSLGIDLGNTNGQTSQALLALQAALKKLKPQAFGSDFQGLLDNASFSESLHGGQLTLGDYKSAIDTSGSPVLAALFQGIDLNNPADLATLQSRILAVGAGVNSLGNADIGNLSRGQITSTLTALAGLIPAPSTGSSGGASPPASYVATPTGASLIGTPTASVDFGLSDLATVLGAKIDQTNALLAWIHGDTGQIADSNDAILAAVTGGALARTLSAQLQAGADVTTINRGG